MTPLLIITGVVIRSQNHLRGLLLITIPKLLLSVTLRPDSARDDHLLLIMTLEPTLIMTPTLRPASISHTRRWGLLLLTLIMMPRPASDHDTEAFSRSQHRGLIFDAAAEAFYIPIKR